MAKKYINKAQGTDNITTARNIIVQAPFDVRSVVETYDDLFSKSTFVINELYVGMIVATYDTQDVYILTQLPGGRDNATAWAEHIKWKKINGAADIDLSEYAKKADLEEFLSSSDLDDYVRVEELENYIPMDILEDLATKSDLEGYVKTEDAIDYLTASDLEGYATQEWVESQGYLTTTNLRIPSSWDTNHTMKDLIDDINADETAVVGKSYIGTIRVSDLLVSEDSSWYDKKLIQAEMKIDIMADEGGEIGKVIVFTVTSTLKPYHWEYTSSWGNEGEWRSFLTEHQDLSEYQKIAELPDFLMASDLDEYVRVEELENYIPKEKLEELATKSELEGYVKAEDAIDFLTSSDLDGYATQEWVESQGYLTEHQDLSDYVKKSDLPEDVASEQYVDQKIEDLVGGAPETLDTLKEIAEALEDNATMQMVADAISTKANADDVFTKDEIIERIGIVGSEVESDVYEYIYDKASWEESYNNGVLKEYYTKYPNEDLWNFDTNTRPGFNDKIYTVEVYTDAECEGEYVVKQYHAQWYSDNGVQRIYDVEEEGLDLEERTYYYLPTFFDVPADIFQLYGGANGGYVATPEDLVYPTGKYIKVKEVSFGGPNVRPAWEAAVSAPGAQFPWIALKVENVSNKIVKFEYEGKAPVYPWGENRFGLGGKAWGIASVAHEWEENGFLIPENENNGDESWSSDENGFDINKFKLVLVTPSSVKDYVDASVASIDIPEVPENVSAFNNDAGYLTEHQDLSDYVKLAELPDFLLESDLDEYVKVEDLEEYVPKDVLDTLATKSELEGYVKTEDAIAYLTSSDLEGYATENWVESQGYLKAADLPDFLMASDLDDYVRVEELENYIPKDVLEILATKSDLEGYVKTEDAVNYLTSEDLEGYATENWVESQNYVKLAELPDFLLASDLDDYVRVEELENYIPVDVLEDLATKSDLEGYVKTEDAIAYLTASDLDDYATKEWVEGKGYLTEHQDLSEYQKIAELPDFLMASDLDDYVRIEELENYIPMDVLETLATKSDLEGYVRAEDAISYLTPEDLDGYATESWVESQDYVKLAELPDFLMASDLDEYVKIEELENYIPMDVLDELATKSDLEGYVKTEDAIAYLTASDLDDYATKAWVESQGYLTEHQPLDDYVTLMEMEEYPTRTEVHNMITEAEPDTIPNSDILNLF